MSDIISSDDGVKIRYGVKEDGIYMSKWLFDEKILRWFPMTTKEEIDDSVKGCMNYAPYNAVITAEVDGVPCGMICLYLQSFYKICHSCLFVIIVDKNYRNKGIGTKLLNETFKIAKEKFKIEILNLEVYEGNPAINLYKRMGFKEFGRQDKFIKFKDGTYLSKIMMEKHL